MTVYTISTGRLNLHYFMFSSLAISCPHFIERVMEAILVMYEQLNSNLIVRVHPSGVNDGA